MKVKNHYFCILLEYIATKPFSEELFHIDAAGSAAIDFVKIFQSVFHFCNEMNLLKSHAKLESEVSSNNARYNVTCHKGYIKYLLHLCIYFSGTNGPKNDGSVLLDSSRNESIEKQDELDEQMHSKVEECEAGSSSSKTPILRISSTSHTIHKLKKKKKTLNDFIM